MPPSFNLINHSSINKSFKNHLRIHLKQLRLFFFFYLERIHMKITQQFFCVQPKKKPCRSKKKVKVISWLLRWTNTDFSLSLLRFKVKNVIWVFGKTALLPIITCCASTSTKKINKNYIYRLNCYVNKNGASSVLFKEIKARPVGKKKYTNKPHCHTTIEVAESVKKI